MKASIVFLFFFVLFLHSSLVRADYLGTRLCDKAIDESFFDENEQAKELYIYFSKLRNSLIELQDHPQFKCKNSFVEIKDICREDSGEFWFSLLYLRLQQGSVSLTHSLNLSPLAHSDLFDGVSLNDGELEWNNETTDWGNGFLPEPSASLIYGKMKNDRLEELFFRKGKSWTTLSDFSVKKYKCL
jgi:hypothetical protein